MSARTRRRFRRRLGKLLFALVLIAGLALLVFKALDRGYDVYVESTYTLEHYETVEAACEQYGVPMSLAYAIIRTESGFDETAHSTADAYGLMQMTQTGLDWIRQRSDEFDDVTVDDLYDPQTNIRCGVYYLSLLRAEFENDDTVAAAYNAGIGKVWAWLDDPACSDDGKTLHTIPYKETRTYVKRVASSRALYQEYYHLT
ncbi:MAG: lytic transglycosylase domain-containing protein [Clostridia bacterium]|nr:lytic transglycosylase domain-containing protein [Clostridia bacterium]